MRGPALHRARTTNIPARTTLVPPILLAEKEKVL
jgi:hypothetical protein